MSDFLKIKFIIMLSFYVLHMYLKANMWTFLFLKLHFHFCNYSCHFFFFAHILVLFFCVYSFRTSPFLSFQSAETAEVKKNKTKTQKLCNLDSIHFLFTNLKDEFHTGMLWSIGKGSLAVDFWSFQLLKCFNLRKFLAWKKNSFDK